MRTRSSPILNCSSIAISADSPHWTLSDLSVDHVLLRLEIKNLQFWQATALKDLLVSQSIAIMGQIDLEGDGRGAEWCRKARIAWHCKQASIGAVTAHLFDLRSAKAKDTNTQKDLLIKLEAENRFLQKKLEKSRKHSELIERHRVTAYRVLGERFSPEVMQSVYQEVDRQLKDQ